jgi:hypothetical protein
MKSDEMVLLFHAMGDEESLGSGNPTGFFPSRTAAEPAKLNSTITAVTPLFLCPPRKKAAFMSQRSATTGDDD